MTQTNDHPIGHGTDIIAGSGSEILEQIKSFGWEYGPKIIGAIITLIIGFWIIRLVMKGLGRLFEKKQLDVTLQPFLLALVGFYVLVMEFRYFELSIGISFQK